MSLSRWLAALLLLAAAARTQAAPPREVASCYGCDHRKDIKDVDDPTLLNAAQAAAVLVSTSEVEPAQTRGWLRLDTVPFTSVSDGPLCRRERFYGQPTAGFCTAFLVGPDLMATAGHCVVSRQDCAGLRVVFGFKMPGPGGDPALVPAGNVFSCKKLLAHVYNDVSDWALFRLNRRAYGRRPLDIDRAAGSPKRGAKVSLVGYPYGLPLKSATGGRVLAKYAHYFVADLDVYAGNSGSPVIGEDGLVEGVIINGTEGDDWLASFETGADGQDVECWKSKILARDHQTGMGITNIGLLAPHIPLPPERRHAVCVALRRSRFNASSFAALGRAALVGGLSKVYDGAGRPVGRHQRGGVR
ncbi:MAG: trypsin-like peptidase domain-containing protein [Elusimicrobia bacterium]|nr:trypsin-like peptidase domain-containing protein [Elusimicrobiota bacterium]MDE2426644.1 trypsin-like peptidase domain-containing protein [Elusimicrobiota bacterium]